MKKTFFFSLIILSTSYALTLDEAVNTAVQNNLQLKQSKKEIEISKLSLKEDKNLWMPVFFSNLSYTYLKDTPYTEIPPIPPAIPSIRFKQFNRDFWNFELGINYPVFTGFKRTNKIKISKLSITAQKYIHKEKVNEVSLKTKLAYLNVLKAKTALKIYKSQEKSIKLHLKQAEEFLRQGLTTKVDLMQAKVRLFKVRTKIKENSSKLRLSKVNLANILGISLNENLSVEDLNFNFSKSLKLEELYKLALKNRAILKSVNTKKDQLSLAANIKKASFYPQVVAQAKYTYTSQYPYLTPKDNLAFTVALNWQFQGIKPYYEYLKEKEKEKKLKLKLKELERNIKLQVRSAFEEFEVAKEEVKLSKEHLKEAKEYYDMVQIQYKNQLTSMSELLDAESFYTSAKLSLRLSEYKLIEAYFRLESAVGGKIQ